MHTLLYLFAIVCLSQAATFARLAHGVQPEVVGFWRLLGASIIMLPFALQNLSPWRLWKEHRREFWGTVLSSFFFFGHLWTYIYAVQNTLIARAMILYCSNPLYIALGAVILFKQKLHPKLFIAYALAGAGLYLLLKEELYLGEWSAGDVSALVSALLFAGYILSGNFVRQKIPNTSYTFLKYFLTSVFFLILGFIRGSEWTEDNTLIAWLAIAGYIIFPTLCGHAMFSYLMKHMNVAWMSCGKLMEPVMSAIAAFYFFGEQLRPNTISAFALTSSAVLILFIPWDRLPLLQKKS